MKKKLTQSQIKERQEKTKKIKSLLIRSLNIVCYCLSVLFIIMAIAIGVQSCNNKNKTESAAINPSNKIQLRNDVVASDYKYFYTSKFEGQTGNVSVDSSIVENIIEYYNISSVVTDTQPSAIYKSVSFTNCYIVYDDTSLLIQRGNIVFRFYDTGYGVFEPYLDVLQFLTSDSVWRTVMTCVPSVSYYTFTFQARQQILASSEQSDNIVLCELYIEQEINPVSFTFNSQINYNATYNGGFDLPFMTIGSTAESTQSTYDCGWFMSGGRIFNQIKFYWINSASSWFKYPNDEELHKADSNVNIYSHFVMMEYRNTLTGNGVTVNSRNLVPFDNNGGLSYYVDNSSTWISVNYQTITLITDTSESNITYLNKYNNANLTNGSITGGDVGAGNAFGLISTAFSSLIPFITIQILPGISIGLLLFIPLIVIIIVLVFRVVKK